MPKLTDAQKASRKATRAANLESKREEAARTDYINQPMTEDEQAALDQVARVFFPDMNDVKELFSSATNGKELNVSDDSLRVQLWSLATEKKFTMNHVMKVLRNAQFAREVEKSKLRELLLSELQD